VQDSVIPGGGRVLHFDELVIGQSQINDSGPPLPLAKILPSGEKANDSNRFFGPVNVRRNVPV
jgi:hypothetical protein